QVMSYLDVITWVVISVSSLGRHWNAKAPPWRLRSKSVRRQFTPPGTNTWSKSVPSSSRSRWLSEDTHASCSQSYTQPSPLGTPSGCSAGVRPRREYGWIWMPSDWVASSEYETLARKPISPTPVCQRSLNRNEAEGRASWALSP